MTITHRKPQHVSDDIQRELCDHISLYDISTTLVHSLALNEPGDQFSCDACNCDLTHTIRIKCADPICMTGDGVDICPGCFCAGKEFDKHLRGHPYRVIVSENGKTVTAVELTDKPFTRR